MLIRWHDLLKILFLSGAALYLSKDISYMSIGQFEMATKKVQSVGFRELHTYKRLESEPYHTPQWI